MQSTDASSDTTNFLGSLKVTDTELPDGSAVFTFDGSDNDMETIVKVGMRDIINKDLLELDSYLAPNFDYLTEEDQFTNYFFAYTVKTGLMNMLKDFEEDNQGKLF